MTLPLPDEDFRAFACDEWNHEIVVHEALQGALILEVSDLELALRGHLSYHSVEILICPQERSHVEEGSEVLVRGSLFQKVLVS